MKSLKLFSAGICFFLLCISCYDQTSPVTDQHLAGQPSLETKEDTITQLKNYIDLKGLRQGAWTLYGKESKDSSYAPDAKWREGIYVDSKEEGIWLEYFPNGMIKRKINFRRGVEVK
ncbi:MAG TPA: hypothetical protein VFJ43_12980 [Bacteroidia bacterium]|nr:hypothetical protein [Bacteroidia bacterium]